MEKSSSSSSSGSTRLSFSDPSLLTIIVDVTPYEWQERDTIRMVRDKNNLKKERTKKPDPVPASFKELISSTLAFCSSFAALNRENSLVVIAVAGDDTAVVHPRKGAALKSSVHDPAETVGCKVDARRLHDDVMWGVAELVERHSKRLAWCSQQASHREPLPRGAAVAAAFSLALCLINRFLVAAHAGTSAVSGVSGYNCSSTSHDDEKGSIVPSLLMSNDSNRAAALEQESLRRRSRGMLSPRIFIIQATPDRTKDYNAFMNAAFAAIKANVPVDGCFLKKPSFNNNNTAAETSVFLEQTCDRTNGIYFKPSANTQPNGGLLEIFLTAFLPSVGIRSGLSLPRSQEVNFRARCFQTGESVDMAHVCNLCLSIFKKRPDTFCPTCGATVMNSNKRKRDHSS